jgi:hypothetical protein
VNTYSLLQQFQWSLENVAPPANLWHGYKAEAYGCTEEMRLRTREVFLGTDIFILTLGLSEIWYDEVTGGVFWRAVPKECYVPGRHKFRVCSFQETKANIQAIYDLIQKHVPGAKLMFTVSPVPLAATFRPASCLTANSVSKALLRAALDEFYRDNAAHLNQNLLYYPSYEIVSHLFPDSYDEDNRHPKMIIVDFIMKLFETVYCETDKTLADANALYQETLKAVQATIPR